VDAITVLMETLKTCAIVLGSYFLVKNCKRDTYEIPLKTDVLLLQTGYHVVAQI
jgi:hypothetical protein